MRSRVYLLQSLVALVVITRVADLASGIVDEIKVILRAITGSTGSDYKRDDSSR